MVEGGGLDGCGRRGVDRGHAGRYDVSHRVIFGWVGVRKCRKRAHPRLFVRRWGGGQESGSRRIWVKIRGGNGWYM